MVLKKGVTKGLYIDAIEASRIYNLSDRHIRRLCKQRKLVSKKSSGRWFILNSSLKGYIEYRKGLKAGFNKL